MKAMVLAAGLGTRLRPLTDDRPKALVEVGGRTLLEITLRRLRSFGVTDVIVNAHHFAEMIAAHLKNNHNFGLNIVISREDVLLDTGGGLKNAGYFFAASSGNEPFILHNVDVISDIDLRRMLQFHRENQPLATLAVQQRTTSRNLLFDDSGWLCGRQSAKDGKLLVAKPAPHFQPLAFCGIHVISSRLLPMLTEEGVFSIITSYLRLATQGEKILAFRADEYDWLDLGTPESLALANGNLKLASHES